MSPRPRALLRCPGPLPLLAALDATDRAPPSLHRPEASRIFVGDARIWSWPGLRDFGALAILDADRFEPAPDPHQAAAGWYTLTPAAAARLGPDDVVYVPDAECAACIEQSPTAAMARERLAASFPADLAARVATRRQAMERYRAQLADIEAVHTRGLIGALPAHLAGAFDRPFHMVDAALRDAAHAAAVAALRAHPETVP